ncbi:MAG: hypothetical protein CML23_21055, partial [Rhizobiaceae bacterium]|nr:hypothetical protein [Rhizobiaceae bacterium]
GAPVIMLEFEIRHIRQFLRSALDFGTAESGLSFSHAAPASNRREGSRSGWLCNLYSKTTAI